MGTFKYDGTVTNFDDIVLAHLQIAILQKLRRQESFSLSWLDPTAEGGRTVIWLHASVVISFHYSAPDPGPIDRAWTEKLILAAGTPAGMFVTDAEGQRVHSGNTTQYG
jgi:hypothetical protein